MGAAKIIKDQELYVWDYCDPSLRISSKLALSCLSNEDVYSIVRSSLEGMSNREGSLTSFLQYERPTLLWTISLNDVCSRKNPDKAFIALRMISQMARHEPAAILDFLDFAESSLETIEWDEVDNALHFPSRFHFRFQMASDFISRKITLAILREVFTLSCYPSIS